MLLPVWRVQRMGVALTRREMLRLGAGTLLSLGLWPGRLRGEDAPSHDEFTFIAVNDLHCSEPACRPWFDKVVRDMKTSVPNAEFCLLGGDLADSGSPAQLNSVREAFQKLEIPVYAVVGNHDYEAGKGRSAYEQIFARQINYRFEHRGWQFLGLDTTEGFKYSDTSISDVTLRWLDENVPKLDPRKPTVIFTHFPLGHFVVTRPLNADALLQRCLKLNLQAVFSGHFHGFTERDFGRAILTTDRCCSRIRGNHDGTPEKGWFVCKAARGRSQSDIR